MRRRQLALCIAAALAFAISPAHAQDPEFHIGVVASVTGPFAAPTKDTFDGFSAWMKQHGLPNRKIVLFGYDVGLITEAAVKNSDGTRQGIRDAMENLKDLPAVNGPVTFSPKDHTGQDYRSLTMAKLAHGVLTPAD